MRLGGCIPLQCAAVILLNVKNNVMKEKLLSTNFLLALLVLAGGLFSLQPGVAEQIGQAVLAIIASVGVVREALKGAAFVGWGAILRDMNIWNYIVAAVVALLPLAGELAPIVRRAIDAVLLKDWGGLLAALFSAVTIIIKLAGGAGRKV